MEKTNLEIVFILDESGSMCNLREDTIKGYNKILEEQKGKEGKAIVTAVAFNEFNRVIHNAEDIEKVKPITSKDYHPDGCTALYDAIGSTIAKVSERNDQAGKVMFVIITDGMENASKEYGRRAIKTLVKAKEEQGWEFLFLGANIDSFEAANDIGIKSDCTVNYNPDREGVEVLYSCLSETVSHMRKNKPLSAGWKKSIEEDFEKRKK